MIKEIINQWEDRKEVLRNYFRTTPQSEYGEYDDPVFVFTYFSLLLLQSALQ